MKEKADNSRGRGKYELTESYKLYADYAFPEKKTRHLRCENAADYFFVHQLMMNVNCPIGNMFCGSVMSVVLLLYHELKWIHQTEHQ